MKTVLAYDEDTVPGVDVQTYDARGQAAVVYVNGKPVRPSEAITGATTQRSRAVIPPCLRRDNIPAPRRRAAAARASDGKNPSASDRRRRNRARRTEPREPHRLLDFLRSECGLTGAKLGCGEGGCGACTVIVGDWDRAADAPRHRSVNGCLAPALSCVGLHVTTVEGLGTAAAPHPVQKRIADCHGSESASDSLFFWGW